MNTTTFQPGTAVTVTVRHAGRAARSRVNHYQGIVERTYTIHGAYVDTERVVVRLAPSMQVVRTFDADEVAASETPDNLR